MGKVSLAFALALSLALVSESGLANPDDEPGVLIVDNGPTQIPEPGTLLSLITGLVAVALRLRKDK